MKKTITMIGAFIVLLISMVSCSDANSADKTDKRAVSENKDTTAIKETNVEVEDKIEPGKILKVTLTYSESSLDNEYSVDLTEILKNGSELYFNGCNTQEINNIKIEGSGNHLTLSIKSSDGSVIFEKKDFSIDKSITLTEKDKVALGSITITQENKNLFKNTIYISGCN
jgi:hypothetical protein